MDRLVFKPGSTERVYYTIPETMELFGVSRHTVRKWLDDGTLAGHMIRDREYVTVVSVTRAIATWYPGAGVPEEAPQRAVG